MSGNLPVRRMRGSVKRFTQRLPQPSSRIYVGPGKLEEIAGYCKELEESARRGDLQRAPALIEQMEREFAIVRILFKQERQRYR